MFINMIISWRGRNRRNLYLQPEVRYCTRMENMFPALLGYWYEYVFGFTRTCVNLRRNLALDSIAKVRMIKALIKHLGAVRVVSCWN